MNLLADESVDWPIVERLRADGHDVLAVVEMEPGLPDEDVLTLANQRGALAADSGHGLWRVSLSAAPPDDRRGINPLSRLIGCNKVGGCLHSHPGACKRTGRSIHRGEPWHDTDSPPHVRRSPPHLARATTRAAVRGYSRAVRTGSLLSYPGAQVA
jgi:hypothetical protein